MFGVAQDAGAMRRQVPPMPGERLRWLRRGLSLLTVAALLAGVGWGMEQLYQRLNVAIGVIAVKGEFSQVDQGAIQRLVEPLVTGGFLNLDLQKIRRELELHPWILQARVSRRWPDGLLIAVTEEVPIARWGNTAFLNVRGERREIGDNGVLSYLPMLQGGDQSERQLMKSYREMAQLLQSSGLRIAALKRDDRGAWWLRLDNNLELVIGRDQVMEKMRRFLEVWEQQLKEQAQRVARVDVRYDNGVAVQWVLEHTRVNGQIGQKLTGVAAAPGQV
ncbi:cell division protein FtsQ/DivIB [Porticoccus sp.]